MSDDSHLPTPLAHGRWAGDRVGRSAREAGASLKTLSKRATLTEQSGTDSAAAASSGGSQKSSGVSVVDCSGLSSQEEQSRMGSSLPESRRGATLYSASWPRGCPPERSAQGCGERLPPSRGASGHFAPSAVTASAAVVAQPAAAIAVSATAVSVATTAATARWFVI